MTTHAPGSNAPLHGRDKKALKRLEELTEMYVAEGMAKDDAKQRARDEMRNNPRRDWRVR